MTLRLKREAPGLGTGTMRGAPGRHPRPCAGRAAPPETGR